jgi:hypothetical protein
MRNRRWKQIVDKTSPTRQQTGIFSPGHIGCAATIGKLPKTESGTEKRALASAYWRLGTLYDKAKAGLGVAGAFFER